MSGNGTEMREVAVRHQEAAMLGLTPRSIEEMVSVAKWMATAKLVPRHLQGDVGSCLMVVEQAVRWGMSPFAVAQCTSVISGKLMYEGKLVAAAIETSGAIDGHLDYEFSGAGDDRTVTVTAKRRGDLTPRAIDIRLGDVKTTNEWWRKQPDQQLVYSGSRNWARRWTPAVMLGVYSPEEWGRDVDKTVEQFGGQTIDGQPEAEPELPKVTPTPAPVTAPKTRSAAAVVDDIEARAQAATTSEDLNALERDDDVRKVREVLPIGRPQRDRLEALLAAERARIMAFEQGRPADELDDVLDGDPPDGYARRVDEMIAMIATAATHDQIDKQILGSDMATRIIGEITRQGRTDLIARIEAARQARLDTLNTPHRIAE